MTIVIRKIENDQIEASVYRVSDGHEEVMCSKVKDHHTNTDFPAHVMMSTDLTRFRDILTMACTLVKILDEGHEAILKIDDLGFVDTSLFGLYEENYKKSEPDITKYRLLWIKWWKDRTGCSLRVAKAEMDERLNKLYGGLNEQ